MTVEKELKMFSFLSHQVQGGLTMCGSVSDVLCLHLTVNHSLHSDGQCGDQRKWTMATEGRSTEMEWEDGMRTKGIKSRDWRSPAAPKASTTWSAPVERE